MLTVRHGLFRPGLGDRHSGRAAGQDRPAAAYAYRDSDTLHDALMTRMVGLPGALLRAIIWDQGTEMARPLTITRSLGTPVYFCDSHSPWQRGSNENMNGLSRDYFLKGTDPGVHSPQRLLAVEHELNNRPRRVLNDRAPAELFAALLASESPSVLRC
jgi:transposase, IS30 family